MSLSISLTPSSALELITVIPSGWSSNIRLAPLRSVLNAAVTIIAQLPGPPHLFALKFDHLHWLPSLLGFNSMSQHSGLVLVKLLHVGL